MEKRDFKNWEYRWLSEPRYALGELACEEIDEQVNESLIYGFKLNGFEAWDGEQISAEMSQFYLRLINQSSSYHARELRYIAWIAANDDKLLPEEIPHSVVRVESEAERSFVLGAGIAFSVMCNQMFNEGTEIVPMKADESYINNAIVERETFSGKEVSDSSKALIHKCRDSFVSIEPLWANAVTKVGEWTESQSEWIELGVGYMFWRMNELNKDRRKQLMETRPFAHQPSERIQNLHNRIDEIKSSSNSSIEILQRQISSLEEQEQVYFNLFKSHDVQIVSTDRTVEVGGLFYDISLELEENEIIEPIVVIHYFVEYENGESEIQNCVIKRDDYIEFSFTRNPSAC